MDGKQRVETESPFLTLTVQLSHLWHWTQTPGDLPDGPRLQDPYADVHRACALKLMAEVSVMRAKEAYGAYKEHVKGKEKRGTPTQAETGETEGSGEKGESGVDTAAEGAETGGEASTTQAEEGDTVREGEVEEKKADADGAATSSKPTPTPAPTPAPTMPPVPALLPGKVRTLLTRLRVAEGPGQVVKGLEAMREMAETVKNDVYMYETGCHMAALYCMSTYASSPEVVTAGARALWTIVFEENPHPMRQGIVDLGAVPLTLELMGKHFHSHLPVNWLVALLSVLATKDSNRDLMFRLQCHVQVMKAVQKHRTNVGVVTQACGFFRNVCQGGATRQVALVKLKVVPLLLRCLSEHRNDTVLVRWLLLALEMMGNAAANLPEMYGEGCHLHCLAVLKSMGGVKAAEREKKSDKLAHYIRVSALALMSRLCVDRDTTCLVKAGAVSVLTTLYKSVDRYQGGGETDTKTGKKSETEPLTEKEKERERERDLSLLGHILSAVSSISENKANVHALYKGDWHNLQVTAFRSYYTDASIVSSLCRLCSWMSRDATSVKRCIVQAGMPEAMVLAHTQWRSNTGIIADILWAISHMGATGRHCPVLMDAKWHEHAYESLKEHPTDIKVCRQSMCLLNVLAKNDADRTASVYSLGCVGTVIKAMRNHLDNTDVVWRGLLLLTTLTTPMLERASPSEMRECGEVCGEVLAKQKEAKVDHQTVKASAGLATTLVEKMSEGVKKVCGEAGIEVEGEAGENADAVEEEAQTVDETQTDAGNTGQSPEEGEPDTAGESMADRATATAEAAEKGEDPAETTAVTVEEGEGKGEDPEGEGEGEREKGVEEDPAPLSQDTEAQ
ncbi:hypothetical protein KIPB_004280 [Kipferlia bialata]|uniref:Uncharacterized protein n=1 Tax=Kipferlia bialata TaxID=797122 RepID=A0A9K3CTH6_9EUKA|nr:hypothetical protein KIPB_004280 [Kipferlia bialata]|eukprot:g4280.t1